MKLTKKLKVYNFDFNAKLPERNNEDLGFDVRTIEKVVLKANSVNEIKTGLCFILPRWKGLTFQTRSSFAKKGQITVGGIVDGSYTGEVKVFILNSTDTDVVIEKGEKFCQFLLVKTPSNSFWQKVKEFFLDFLVIEEFEQANYEQLLEKQRTSIRKAGGFGSTNSNKS